MRNLLMAMSIYVCCCAPLSHSAEVGFATLPLTVPVRTWELRDFSTVGAMADYLLHRVGYQLALGYPAPEAALTISRRPINPGIYAHEILTIEDILIYAVGPNNKLIVDVRNKLVSFDRVSNSVVAPENPNARYFTGRLSELRE